MHNKICLLYQRKAGEENTICGLPFNQKHHSKRKSLKSHHAVKEINKPFNRSHQIKIFSFYFFRTQNHVITIKLSNCLVYITHFYVYYLVDFDWTLYLGLAFVTAVFFAFGAALICCARKGIRVNQHYNMTRTGKFSFNI